MSFLLRHFRSDQRQVWEQLSQAVGGVLVPAQGILGKDRVEVQHGPWTLVLDTFSPPKQPTYTRLRANYVNRDSFFFRIYRRTLIPSYYIRYPGEDIPVGYPDFDRAFVIQSNDPQKVRQFFANDRIREIIRWQPEIVLQNQVDESWMIRPMQEGISLLVFQVPNVITDLDQLHDLFDLFAEILNQLCHIGSAYEDDPSQIF